MIAKLFRMTNQTLSILRPSFQLTLLLLATSIIPNPLADAFNEQAMASHPFHVTTAEARWNPESGRLEISVRCHPIDLENALRKMTGKQIDLDKTPEVDNLITDYLNQNFILRDPAKKAKEIADPKIKQQAEKSKAEAQPGLAKLHWVGKEIDAKWAWLYFELEPESRVGDLILTNTLLMEVLEDQTNTVLVLQGTKRKSLLFRANTKTLSFPRAEDLEKVETTVKTPGSEVKE
jgi:hypothetical protein